MPRHPTPPPAPEAIVALSKISRAAAQVRSRYRGEIRKVVTPMMPLFRHSVLSNIAWRGLTGTETVGIMREVLSEVGRELELFEIKRADLEALKTAFPRVQMFKRAASLSVTQVSDISSVLDVQKLVKLMSDHAYKLRAAVEKEPSKYLATFGKWRKAPPLSAWIEQFIYPTLSRISSLSPGSFGFIVDFSVAGGLGEFLGAFFSGLGRNPKEREKIQALFTQAGWNYVVNEQGIFRVTKTGRLMKPTRIALAVAAEKILKESLTPALKQLWLETVEDFMLREPTSVSRWFPNRPMGRKSLKGKRESLLGMLKTGKVRFRLAPGDVGILGHFSDFDTNLAPYWPVVQYGYPGKIRAKHGRVLTLKDPDPEWWQKVQWAFGMRVEKSVIRETSTTLHPLTMKRAKSLGRFAATTAKTAKVPLLLPSGRRFTMLFHPSLYEPGAAVPVYSETKVGRRYQRKHLTYSLTITPKPIHRTEVRGQRASLFIERLIAMMAERQKLLEQAFFNAATAYLYVGEQTWNEIVSLFRSAGQWRLGG